MFSITRDRIEEMPFPKAAASSGARAIFEGIVRDQNEGRQVERLEYEAMESLACKEGNRIIEEALGKFPIHSAECIHRIGTLEVGEIAIRVVLTAGHRDGAFAACRYVVDEVKARVPIWKKEHYTSGETGWINAGQNVDV